MIWKFLCLVFGHNFKSERTDKVMFGVYDITFVCSTCKKKLPPTAYRPDALESNKIEYQLWLKHWNQREQEWKRANAKENKTSL